MNKRVSYCGSRGCIVRRRFRRWPGNDSEHGRAKGRRANTRRRAASSCGSRRASRSRRRSSGPSPSCATIRRRAPSSSTRSPGRSSTRCSNAGWFPDRTTVTHRVGHNDRRRDDRNRNSRTRIVARRRRSAGWGSECATGQHPLPRLPSPPPRRLEAGTRGARAQGHGHPEGHEREARGGEGDVVHGGRHLRESEPPRTSARLHDDLRSRDAAPGQASRDHPGRRPGVGVLLRRKVDDGVRAGRESGRRGRGAADHRCDVEGGVRHGGDLLPVLRRRRGRSVSGHRRGPQSGVLHRPVQGDRRGDDGHGGVRQRQRPRADMDRRRGQAAAHAARHLSRRPAAFAPPDGASATGSSIPRWPPKRSHPPRRHRP